MTETTKRLAKDFSKEERRTIVEECTEKFVSPTVLAQRFGVNVTAIRDWVKNAGKKLPAKYKVTSTAPDKGNSANNSAKNNVPTPPNSGTPMGTPGIVTSNVAQVSQATVQSATISTTVQQPVHQNTPK